MQREAEARSREKVATKVAEGSRTPRCFRGVRATPTTSPGVRLSSAVLTFVRSSEFATRREQLRGFALRALLPIKYSDSIEILPFVARF